MVGACQCERQPRRMWLSGGSWTQKQHRRSIHNFSLPSKFLPRYLMEQRLLEAKAKGILDNIATLNKRTEQEKDM